MTANTSIQLKPLKGWFAAGESVQRAIGLLSDGAFKLFVYVCLQARRDTGRLEATQSSLAAGLKKSRGAVARHLQELQTMGLCRIQMTHHPQGQGVVEITEPYWPYERKPQQPPPPEEAAYVAQVKKYLAVRLCVRITFSFADERLVREWFQQGIASDCIEKAILLGCARKQMAWREGYSPSFIGSLKYFEPVLQEISTLPIDSSYWDYLLSRLDGMEKLWIREGCQHPETQPEGGHRQ